MHKKLEAELVSLAHSILQMKSKNEVFTLKEKAKDIYEKLSVLSFVEDYIASTPKAEISKEELLKQIEEKVNITEETISTDSTTIGLEKEVKTEEIQTEDIFEPKFDSVKIDIESLRSDQISSKEEFRDAISADKTSTLFDDVERKGSEKKSLNDSLVKNTIQVGLNDRIAFVNHLFDFNQQDFNRVLSQLNTFKGEKEAKDFIYNNVKPEYNWEGKEEYEERLITLIERKFS